MKETQNQVAFYLGLDRVTQTKALIAMEDGINKIRHPPTANMPLHNPDDDAPLILRTLLKTVSTFPVPTR